MNCCRFCLPIIGLAALSASIAFAQGAKDKPTTPGTPPAKTTTAPPTGDQPQLPPGWTEADMQACMEAGKPGPMHEHLAQASGTWQGKVTMWMGPGSEPQKSECTSVVTGIMDGRFTKCEMSGEMPEMGPFTGFGLYGFDNVSQKFQSSWICNCGTSIMNGIGDLSSDSSTLTWKYSYHCPITKKPTTMREIEKITGKDTKTLETFGIDPKSGKEYKMMEIAFTRTGTATAAAPTSGSGHGH